MERESREKRDRRIEVDRIARMARNALGGWHSWLASRALIYDDWHEVPRWARASVRKLDIDWVLSGDVRWYKDRQYFGVFEHRVFSLHQGTLDAKEDFPDMPDMKRLLDQVRSFREEFHERSAI